MSPIEKLRAENRELRAALWEARESVLTCLMKKSLREIILKTIDDALGNTRENGSIMR
jgi:hypothetical protein